MFNPLRTRDFGATLYTFISSCFTYYYEYRRNISSRFSSNSEAKASRFLENLEEMSNLCLTLTTPDLTIYSNVLPVTHYIQKLAKLVENLEELFHQYYMLSEDSIQIYNDVLIVQDLNMLQDYM